MRFSILEWLDTNPLFPFCVFFIWTYLIFNINKIGRREK